MKKAGRTVLPVFCCYNRNGMDRREARKTAKKLSAMPAFAGSLGNLPRSERIKRIPRILPVRHALYTVFRNDACVRKAAEQAGVQCSAVQAILFRETLGFGIEDLLDHFRRNASRGLCQIKPQTAIRADRDLGLGESGYRDVCRKLRSIEGNLLYCARIVRSEADRIGADPQFLTDEQLREIFLRYNGSGQYAENTLQYCRCFEEQEKSRPKQAARF